MNYSRLSHKLEMILRKVSSSNECNLLRPQSFSKFKKKKKIRKLPVYVSLAFLEFLHLHSLAALFLCEHLLANKTGFKLERQQE